MISSGLRLVQSDPEVDFGSIATRELGFEDRLDLGKFSLKIGAFKACEGTNILSSDICVVIPDRRLLNVDCLGPYSDHLQSRSFTPGNVRVAGGDVGFWFRCRAAPSFFAFSMDRSFVRGDLGSGFQRRGRVRDQERCRPCRSRRRESRARGRERTDGEPVHAF